jgi:L,D-peptidoglycan transpeptidase YkuD (ErfK/YbiS/YcfS/YnhG family)
MIIRVTPDGWAHWQGRAVRAALGRSGVIAAADKREGDGATPAGLWKLRRLLYRADRHSVPQTGLSLQPIQPQDGWCDAPDDPQYNQPVHHPYAASAEHLWREDGAYDLIVPLGYNDAPAVSGRGSAIFLHCAQPDFRATEGCVALASADLLKLLAEVDATSQIEIVLP